MDKKKILLVEDEESLQNIIKHKLETEKYEVLSTNNAEEALNILHLNTDIKFIWLDHYLLGKDTGLDLISKIKADSSLKKIPVFLVSNTASPEKIKNYMHLGIDKFYIKSDISLKEIINDINVFVN
jgi:CheY-like chemotaxis protein